MSKKSVKRVGVGVATGGLSEAAKAGKAAAKGDLRGAAFGISGPLGIVADELTKPKGGKLPGAPVLDAEANVDQAEEDEKKRRARRANIATKPLGALVQQALLTRTLTGQ